MGEQTPHRIFAMAFARVYPLYLAKVTKKGRTQAELDAVICWLTGHSVTSLAEVVARGDDFTRFFGEAPRMHPDADKITGVVCGVRVEAVTDPLMRDIRRLDKLVDELARGKALAAILRS
jgi:hypothetical protein